MTRKRPIRRMPLGVRRGDLKPFCHTCGQNRVKTWVNKYCSAECVPKSVRQANCQKGRKTFAYRRRAVIFREHLARMDRSITREELTEVFWSIYRQAYASGFHVGRYGSGKLKDAVERGAA